MWLRRPSSAVCGRAGALSRAGTCGDALEGTGGLPAAGPVQTRCPEHRIPPSIQKAKLLCGGIFTLFPEDPLRPGYPRGRKGGERVRDGEWVADTGTELRGILQSHGGRRVAARRRRR